MSKPKALRELSAEQPPKQASRTANENVTGWMQLSLGELLDRNAKQHPDRLAYRAKIRGLWKEWNWTQAKKEVLQATRFLSDAKVLDGEKVGLCGETDLRLCWYLIAIQRMGAVPVVIHPNISASELEEIHSRSDFGIFITGNVDLVGAAARMRDDGKGIRAIVSLSPDIGMHDDILVAEALDQPEDSVQQADTNAFSGSSNLIVLSGYNHAGAPLLTTYSGDNLHAAVTNLINQTGMTADDELVSFLPLAWEGEFLQFVAALSAGARISVVESTATVLQDLKVLAPSFLLATAAFYRSFLAHIEAQIARSSRLTTFMYARAKANSHQGAGRAGHALDYLFQRPLRGVTGTARARCLYSAGGFLSGDLMERYRAFGVELVDLKARNSADEWAVIHAFLGPDIASALSRHYERLSASLLVRHVVFTEIAAGRWAVVINPDQQFLRACSSDAGAEYEQLIAREEVVAAVMATVRSTNQAAAGQAEPIVLDGFYIFNPPLCADDFTLTRNGDVVYGNLVNISGKTGALVSVPTVESGA